jgi:hypothetical protein
VVRDDQPDAREGSAGRPEVAERFVVPLKPGNAGGGKGPQFKTNAGRRPQIVAVIGSGCHLHHSQVGLGTFEVVSDTDGGDFITTKPVSVRCLTIRSAVIRDIISSAW